MADVKVLPGFCRVSSHARLRIGADNLLDSGFDPLIQQVAHVPLDPYIVQGGQRFADTGIGGRTDVSCEVSSYTVHTDVPLPEDIDLGDWRRWLARGAWLTAPAAGGRRWYPIETAPGDMVDSGVGTSGVLVPRMALYTTVATSVDDTGRSTYGPDSPHLDPAYSYRGFDREMSREAMVFAGSGHASIEVERVFTQTTFGLVAVFHPGDLPHYGVFASNEVEPTVGTAGEPLVFRYTHGLLEVYQAHVRVAAHETHKNAHQAVIILIALDADNDEGRLLVVDSTRTSKQFNIDNLDFVSFGGMVGAEGQATSAEPVTFTADMDVLELTIWDTALSFAELEAKANLLSLAYGVAG